MNLSVFSLSGLMNFITSSGLAILLITLGKSKVERLYSFAVISVAVWGIGGFFIGTSSSIEEALFYWKIAFLGVLFIPIFMLHSVFTLTKKINKKILFFAYSQGVFFSIVNIFNINFWTLKFKFNSMYFPVSSFLAMIAFIFWAFLSFLVVYIATKFYLKIKRDGKNNNKSASLLCFAIASSIGYVAGATNFFSVFNLNLYPYGNLFIPISMIVITFAILKYQLFDINIVIRKGLVYSILITVFTAIYLSIVILAEKIFQVILGYQSLLISIIFASIIAMIFIPLKNRTQSFIDKIFQVRNPDQIALENDLLRQEILRAEKLRTIATFATGMAHEIKNPLTAIKTFTEYLPQKSDDKEFMDKFSKIVGSEVGRIDDLVHQLLDYSKPGPLKLKEEDVHKVLDETLELLSNQFIKNEIKVVKDYALDATRYILKLDSKQIKQALLNIFINSIEAMSSGGVLTVSTNLCSIEKMDSVVVCVEDTGCGIPEKDLPHIFEPFHSSKERGSGLGLSIVDSIIREHKGKVRVDSLLNKKGTIFIIELPINQG